jgi:hypothetical protein
MDSFDMIWNSVCSDNILGRGKSFRLYNELVKTRDVCGAIAEVGVYRGRTAKLMNMTFPDKVLYLYDTFTGIKKSSSEVDIHKDGDFCNTSKDEVIKFIDGDNIYIHEGIFPDTFVESNSNFSFVHSDTDTYFGTKTSLDVFALIINKGGIMVIDDYNWRKCPGVTKAVNEFIETKNIKYKFMSFQAVLYF